MIKTIKLLVVLVGGVGGAFEHGGGGCLGLFSTSLEIFWELIFLAIWNLRPKEGLI